MRIIHQLYQWLKPLPLDCQNPDEYLQSDNGPLYHRGYGFQVRLHPKVWLQGITIDPNDKDWFVPFAEHKLGCLVWDLTSRLDTCPEQGVMMTIEQWMSLWQDPVSIPWKDRQDPTLYTPMDVLKKCKKWEWYSAHEARWASLVEKYEHLTYTEPMNRLETHYFHEGKGYWEDFLFFLGKMTGKPILCLTSQPFHSEYANIADVLVQSNDGGKRFWVHKNSIMDHAVGITWSVHH